MMMEGEEEGEWLIDLPGFRFHPTDEELIQDFLKPWVESNQIICPLIKVFDVYSTPPHKLAGGARSKYLRDGQLYFLSPRYRVSEGGDGTNVRRDAGDGFWHEESCALVTDGSTVIGRKSMFTYKSFASGEGAKGKKRKASGIKTDWIMHEFVLHSPSGNGKGKQFHDKALCRIHLKNSKSESFAGYSNKRTRLQEIPSTRDTITASSSMAPSSLSQICSTSGGDDCAASTSLQCLLTHQGSFDASNDLHMCASVDNGFGGPGTTPLPQHFGLDDLGLDNMQVDLTEFLQQSPGNGTDQGLEGSQSQVVDFNASSKDKDQIGGLSTPLPEDWELDDGFGGLDTIPLPQDSELNDWDLEHVLLDLSEFLGQSPGNGTDLGLEASQSQPDFNGPSNDSVRGSATTLPKDWEPDDVADLNALLSA